MFLDYDKLGVNYVFGVWKELVLFEISWSLKKLRVFIRFIRECFISICYILGY